MERPQHVADAVKNDEVEALSRMGRKGARVAKRRRAHEREFADIIERRKLEEATQEENALRNSTNENKLTVEGTDPNEEE